MASVITDLADSGYFGRIHRLANAQRSLEEFCHERKLGLKVQLSRESLGLGPGQYPELHCKGAQTGIVHRWLQRLAEDDFGNLPAMAGHAQMVRDSGQFLRLCMKGAPFLTEQNALDAFAAGIRFLARYVQANQDAATRQKLRFFIRPKFHLIQHLVMLCTRPSRRSCHLDATWLDEDMIGKMMKVLQGLHPRTANLRALQRFFLDEDRML